MAITRRDIFKFGAIGGVGLALPIGRSIAAGTPSTAASNVMPLQFANPFRRPSVLQQIGTYKDTGQPFFEVSQRQGSANWLRNGTPTTVFGYNGEVPGPTIVADSSGDFARPNTTVVRMRNNLPPRHPFGHEFTTSTHLHGSASLPQYDGYASDVTPPGYYKDYIYPNFQEARTLWYHDHGVHHTAQNAFTGLAGQYHLHDAQERATLPQGEFDVPMTINDTQLDAQGQVSYDDHSQTYEMGDIILVNGVPWPNMPVKQRIYRFRVLNASISRSYRPQLSTGDSVYVVATDGGLVPDAQAVKFWRHGSAERYEILIDFRKYPVGTKIQLLNLSNPNNIDYASTKQIMQFEVTGDAFDKGDPTWNQIPARPNPDSLVMKLNPAAAVRTRRFAVDRSNGLWQFGGKTWEDVIDTNYQFTVADVIPDSTEIWEIENRSGGWFHPVHIHLVDFKILSRNGAPPFAWEKGPKDVVYIGEGETVRVLMQFKNQTGRYMIHCHNLVHEDHDMMGQFRVGADTPNNDPMLSAPAKPNGVDE
ncbi:MAG: hypothetical protein QOJ32_954 [Frankiaceae bacterium]|nr:hypothetical protein [Frankiaceae bacterium]